MALYLLRSLSSLGLIFKSQGVSQPGSGNPTPHPPMVTGGGAGNLKARAGKAPSFSPNLHMGSSFSSSGTISVVQCRSWRTELKKLKPD